MPVFPTCALLVTGVAYALVFGYRTDYLGHYLGGFGGTLLLLAGAFLIPLRWRAWAVVVITVAAIAVGYATESTIFKLAIFDPVDFYNQSLGAVVAATSVVRDQGGLVTGLLLSGLSVVVMIAGFYFAFL